MSAKKVSTLLKLFKKCKSCVRFSTKDKDNETVVTDIYVLNDALDKLGNPKEIELSISVPSKT